MSSVSASDGVGVCVKTVGFEIDMYGHFTLDDCYNTYGIGDVVSNEVYIVSDGGVINDIADLRENYEKTYYEVKKRWHNLYEITGYYNPYSERIEDNIYFVVSDEFRHKEGHVFRKSFGEEKVIAKGLVDSAWKKIDWGYEVGMNSYATVDDRSYLINMGKDDLNSLVDAVYDYQTFDNLVNGRSERPLYDVLHTRSSTVHNYMVDLHGYYHNKFEFEWAECFPRTDIREIRESLCKEGGV